mmetsp:Transcript_22612/g.62919  ORF Transcript_22612/g.62919 Transcript_22612/m.62919 type:complete len:303 (+) Transcript_22612:449-1357(+)
MLVLQIFSGFTENHGHESHFTIAMHGDTDSFIHSLLLSSTIFPCCAVPCRALPVRLLRTPQRLLVFGSRHELRPGRLHFSDARLDLVFRHVSAVPIHDLLETHDAQQRANDSKLSKDPRVQYPHLHRFDHAVLSALAVKNVGHRGHAYRRDALEGIALDKVGRALVGGQRGCVNKADARVQYRLAVQLAELHLLGIRVVLFPLFGPGNGLQIVFAFRGHLVHSVAELLFRGDGKDKEGRHDGEGRSALGIGQFSKPGILHGEPQTTQGRNEHHGRVHHSIVPRRGCDFFASVFGSERGHGGC